jgi:hypothetical protein
MVYHIGVEPWHTVGVHAAHQQPIWAAIGSNPLGELIQLRWDGTITKYQGKVLALLTCCEDLMEKH